MLCVFVIRVNDSSREWWTNHWLQYLYFVWVKKIYIRLGSQPFRWAQVVCIEQVESKYKASSITWMLLLSVSIRNPLYNSSSQSSPISNVSLCILILFSKPQFHSIHSFIHSSVHSQFHRQQHNHNIFTIDIVRVNLLIITIIKLILYLFISFIFIDLKYDLWLTINKKEQEEGVTKKSNNRITRKTKNKNRKEEEEQQQE